MWPSGSMIYPFLSLGRKRSLRLRCTARLYHQKSSTYLTFDGSQVYACSSRDRPGQLWWAVRDRASDPEARPFGLRRCAWRVRVTECGAPGMLPKLIEPLSWPWQEHLANLRLEEPMWLSFDRRMALRCTPEVPGETWTVQPGCQAWKAGISGIPRGRRDAWPCEM